MYLEHMKLKSKKSWLQIAYPLKTDMGRLATPHSTHFHTSQDRDPVLPLPNALEPCRLSLLSPSTVDLSDVCVHAQLLQSYPTLCEPMNYSLIGSSVHRNFQARILEWIACHPPGNPPDPDIEPALQQFFTH